MLRILLETNTSFRTLSEHCKIENEQFNDYPKTPAHTTLENWVYKVGYYELNRLKEQADDWIIILDHSIQMGSSKILVIYGIRSSETDFSRPLVYKDLTTLRIRIREHWNGEDVRDELVSLTKELGTIRYAVADHGSNLKKGLSLAGIPHIHDLSHRIAILLEKRYLKDDRYISFNRELSSMRTKLVQSNLAHLVPLAVRKKSIFQNLGKTADWAFKMLYALKYKNLSKKEKESLAWMLGYEELITELKQLNWTICKIEKVLKSKGLNRDTLRQCNAIVNTEKHLLSIQGQKIIKDILIYAKESLLLLPKEHCVLCTSDIIESAFGKYKNFSSDNKMACITKMVLSLAAITVDINPENVKYILESVQLKDIDRWGKENIGLTSFRKRTDLLSVNKQVSYAKKKAS